MAIIGLTIFIGSPFGLEQERRAIDAAIAKKTFEFQEFNVAFHAVKWETVGRGPGAPQPQINERLKNCDFAIFVFHTHMGSPSKNESYISPTDEEYCLCMKCHEQKSMKDVAIFFKKVAEEQENDPGPELKKLIAFRTSVQSEKPHFYYTFSTDNDFNQQIERCLNTWAVKFLMNKASALLSSKSTSPHLSDIDPSNLIPKELSPEIRFKVQEAWCFADSGNLPKAESQLLTLAAMHGSSELQLEISSFYRRLGNIDKALDFAISAQHLARTEGDKLSLACSHSLIGSIQALHGEMDAAQASYEKALSIYNTEKHKIGEAAIYGYLGILFSDRCNFNEAMKMHSKALAALFNLKNPFGMAICAGNIGLTFLKVNVLDGAEEMFQEALRIFKALDEKENAAATYGNLASVYLHQNKLDEAMEMYQEALAISKRMENREHLANGYGNIGNVFCMQFDFKHAIEMYRKALDIDREIDAKRSIADDCTSLASALLKQGDSEKRKELFFEAETLLLEAERLFKTLGAKDGLAKVYMNLYTFFHLTDGTDKTEKMYQTAYTFSKEANIGKLLEDLEKLKKYFENESALVKISSSSSHTEAFEDFESSEEAGAETVIEARIRPIIKATGLQKIAEAVDGFLTRAILTIAPGVVDEGEEGIETIATDEEAR